MRWLLLVVTGLGFVVSAASAQQRRVRDNRWGDTEYTLHLMSFEWGAWSEAGWDRFRAGLRGSYGSLTPREFSERREIRLDVAPAEWLGFRYDHVRIDNPEDLRDDHLVRLGSRVLPWLWIYLAGDSRADKRFTNVGGAITIRTGRAFLDVVATAVNVFFNSKGIGQETLLGSPMDLRVEGAMDLGAYGRQLLRVMALSPYEVRRAGSAEGAPWTVRLSFWWMVLLGKQTDLLFYYRWLQRGDLLESLVAGAEWAFDLETAVHTWEIAARHRMGEGDRYEIEGGLRTRQEWEIQRREASFSYRRAEWVPHLAFGGRPLHGLWIRGRWLGSFFDLHRRGDGSQRLSGLESKLNLEVEYRFRNQSLLRLVASFDTDPRSFFEFDGGALVLTLGF